MSTTMIPPGANNNPGTTATDAFQTLTPPNANAGIFLHGITYSVDITPPAGSTLTITWNDGSARTITLYLGSVTGPGYVRMEGNAQFPKGVAVTVKIPAATGMKGSIYPLAEYR